MGRFINAPKGWSTTTTTTSGTGTNSFYDQLVNGTFQSNGTWQTVNTIFKYGPDIYLTKGSRHVLTEVYETLVLSLHGKTYEVVIFEGEAWADVFGRLAEAVRQG